MDRRQDEMRPRQISVKNLCLFVALGALLSMLGVIVLFFVMTGSMVVLSAGAADRKSTRLNSSH